MTLRVIAFLAVLLILVTGFVKGLRLPIDVVLLYFLVMIPAVMGLFAHYRYVGLLRATNFTRKALNHLKIWRLLLPLSLYHQLRLQILVESEEPERAALALSDAAERDLVDPAFLWGFRADLARRQGVPASAKKQLEEALQHVPPSLLRAGILTQLARLYAVAMPTPAHLKQIDELLTEAEELIAGPPHTHLIQAVCGEAMLAEGKAEEAASLLRTSLEALLQQSLDEDADEEQVAQTLGFRQRLQRLIAQLTHSQQDEHQHPMYAEFCLSLARAYVALDQRQAAEIAIRRGLTLCHQPFVAKPLRQLQREHDLLS